MRCHICDRVLTEPSFNKDIGAYEPCDPCMTIIMDAVGAFADRPFVEEDELSPDPALTAFWESVLASSIPPDDGAE